jgi:TonB-dependent receptor
MKVCKSPDGVVREQPHFASREQTTAMYYQVDFEQDLPWGMVFNGNFGTRYVSTIAQGTGNMTFTHVSKTSTFDPLNPGASGGTISSSISLNTSINSVTNDWTPSYNLNLWVIPNKVVLRYYTGHVIARPSIGQMLPSGTCTISDVTLGTVDSSGNDVDQQCTGRVGNPGLKPYKAINHNESVEWYVNKDTMVSLAYYYNNVYIGAPQNTTFTQSDLFSGTNFTDPVTGIPLSSTSFTYPTYINGPAGIQRGIELSTKLAFTYLPWLLKYTGTDFNYSQLGSKNSVAARDLITGDALPPQGQASYFENWSIWYDDGRLNARFAYQGRGTTFVSIAPCSNFFNNFPTSFAQNCGSTIRTPYNPGSANFTDKTQYFDAKINYKINKTLELYFDGRNVLHGAAVTNQPSQNFSDGTPTLNNFTYGGTRYTVGFTYRH